MVQLFIVVLGLICGLAATAEAKEKVVPLRYGTTVWGILKAEGCSGDQRTALWPLVARDSGLNPKKERTFPKNHRIVIKRDCDGQPFPNLALRENQESAKPQAVRAEMTAAQETQLGTLTKENGELRKKLADSSSPRLWQFVAGFMFVAFVVAGYLATKWRFAATALATEMARNIQLPPEQVVEHWGVKKIFPRVLNPETREVGFECPDCGQLVFHARNCKGHMRTDHPHEGQFVWKEAA